MDLEKVKNLLREEARHEAAEGDDIAFVLPILHNEDMLILQFYGWSINLYSDGTWIWESTEGG